MPLWAGFTVFAALLAMVLQMRPEPLPDPTSERYDILRRYAAPALELRAAARCSFLPLIRL
jgi:hypothetical protein